MKTFIRNFWLIFTLLVITLSCKQQVDKGGRTEGSNDKATSSKVKEETSNKVPLFENPVVQNYVDSYEVYLNEYANAVDNRDAEALARLGPKGQELALKAQEVSEAMSIEDAQKFRHYLTEKTKVIKELTLRLSE